MEDDAVEVVKRKTELEERVKALEAERASLSTEIEALKAIPPLQARVAALESEVEKFREEKKRLLSYARFTTERP